ncbi:hypothetical protein [Methylobacterium sp. CM6244]
MRGVFPTEASKRPLDVVGSQFAQVEVELTALAEMKDKPAGNMRVPAPEHASQTFLWPVLHPLLSY